MAMNDVECCDFYQVHEDVVKAVTAKMPDEDEPVSYTHLTLPTIRLV